MRRSVPIATLAALFFCVAPAGPASAFHGSDPDLCTAAPRTGCFQSEKVRVWAAHDPDRPRKDFVVWSWTHGDASEPGDLGDPSDGTDYALCLYDGEATGQTETRAPAPGTDSLVSSVDLPAGFGWFRWRDGFIYLGFPFATDGVVFGIARSGENGAVAVVGVGENLGLDALDAIDPANAISQVQTADGSCWGANVTVELRNAPPYELPGIPSADVIDGPKAEALIDELASLYNRKHGGDGPLDMTFFSNALGATEIQNRVVTSDPADLDLQAISSALYVFGWYGGTLFQRDGFQGNPGPAGPGNPDPDAFAGAVSRFRAGIEIATLGSDQEVFDALTSLQGGGPFGVGSGVAAMADTYGYNTGYGYAVLEDLIDVFDPPDDKLVCSGITARTGLNPIHPKLPGLAANAPLYDCEFNPSFLDARPGLRPYLDDYLDATNPNVLALPAALQPAALKGRQDAQEGAGQFVWKVFLGSIIVRDPDYRASLWDVDNAFLEVIEAAGLVGLGALANADAALGRQAVLAGGTVLTGWLSAYTYGLSAPSGPEPHDPATDPRVLPLFDLGTTPIHLFD